MPVVRRIREGLKKIRSSSTRVRVALLVAPLALIAGAAAIIQGDRFEAHIRQGLQDAGAAALGVPVRIDSLQIRLASVPPRIEASGISVELPGDEEIEAESASVFVRPLPLIFGRVDLQSVTVEGLRLVLDLDAGSLSGRLPNGGASGGGIRMERALIRRGTVEVRGGGVDLALDSVEALMTQEAGGVVLDVRSAGRHVRAALGGEMIDESIRSFEGKVVLKRDALELRDAHLETTALTMTVDAQAALGTAGRVTMSRLEVSGPVARLPWIARSLPVRAGTFAWNGPVAIDTKGFQAAGSLSLAGGPVNVGGTLDMEGTIAPAIARGRADLAYSGAAVSRTRIPDGTLSGDFHLSAEGLRVDEVLASAGRSRVTLTGAVSPEGRLDLAFAAEPLALGEIASIEGVAVRGTGPIRDGRIRGPMGALVVEGNVDLAGFHVAGLDLGDGAGPVRLSYADASLSSTGTRFVRGETPYSGPWSVDFTAGRLQVGSKERPIVVGDARVEDLAAIGIITLPPFLSVRGRVNDGEFWLDGPPHALTGGFRAKGTSLDVGGQAFAGFRINGRLDHGVLWLDDLVARRDSGAQLFARGKIGAAPERALALEMHTSGWTLADVDRFATFLDGRVSSAVGAQLRIGGRIGDPEVNGSLRFDETKIGERPVRDSHLKLTSRPRELIVEGSLAGGALTPLVTVAFTEPLVASSASVTLTGLHGESFAMSGAPVNGAWEGRGSGTLDLALVALATGRFSRIEGMLDVKDLLVSRARHRAQAQIRGATFEMASLPVAPTGVTGSFGVEDGVVSLRELAGSAGGGTFRLGSVPGALVVTSALCASRIDVPGIELAGVSLAPSKELKGRVSGPLKLSGGTCEGIPTLGGDLLLEQAKYRGSMKASPARPLGTPSIALDLRVSAPGGGISVKTEQLDAELATADPLRITGDDTAWGIRPGRLALVSGQLKAKGLSFDLRTVDIEFVGDRVIDARYAITAVKKIALWEMTVKVKGQTSRGDPKVDVESSPPLPDDEVRDLLEKTRLREQI